MLQEVVKICPGRTTPDLPLGANVIYLTVGGHTATNKLLTQTGNWQRTKDFALGL